MTLRERIRRWLGIDSETDSLRAEMQRQRSDTQGLAAELQLLRDKSCHDLAALGADFEYTLASALASAKAELKSDFEFRLSVILKASITASNEISRAVASQGDANLKEYVDGVLDIFSSRVQTQLN